MRRRTYQLKAALLGVRETEALAVIRERLGITVAELRVGIKRAWQGLAFVNLGVTVDAPELTETFSLERS